MTNAQPAYRRPGLTLSGR